MRRSTAKQLVSILVIKQDGTLIKHISEPTEEIQKVAVKNDIYAIMHIRNPSSEIQLLAIKSCDYLPKLEYTNNYHSYYFTDKKALEILKNKIMIMKVLGE